MNELPRRPEDQKINIKPGSKLSDARLRRYSEVEELALKRFLETYGDEGNGFITPSSSDRKSNIFFVRKKNGELRSLKP